MRKPLKIKHSRGGKRPTGMWRAVIIADIIDDIISLWFIFNKMEYLTTELSSTSIIWT